MVREASLPFKINQKKEDEKVKKGMIFLVLTVLVVGLLLAGCGVSQTEFQGFQTKVQEEFTAQGARIGEVERVVQAIPGIATDIAAIRDDIKDLKKDQEKDQAVQAVEDQLNAEKAGRQLDALKAKDAELEKGLAEAKASWQPSYWRSDYGAQSGTASVFGQGSIFISQAGDYEFIITPNIRISIDGRNVISHQVISLTSDWHTCYSNYPVQITWRMIWPNPY